MRANVGPIIDRLSKVTSSPVATVGAGSVTRQLLLMLLLVGFRRLRLKTLEKQIAMIQLGETE